MKPELVIFDMDGLMFDTERIYYKAWQEAGKQYGYEISFDIYEQIVARNSRYIEKILKGIFKEGFPYEEIVEKKRSLSDEMIEKEGLVVKEGLYELLQVLKEAKIKKAVATSSDREKAMRYLRLGKVQDQFDYIICGSDVVESKPNPEIFLKVTKKLGCVPERCVVLEDARFGLQAAKAGGMYPILVPDLIAADEEMIGNARKVVSSLKEVIDLIKNEELD